jgi:predicted TIM-barrel fold metal-dependent hydrolase
MAPTLYRCSGGLARVQGRSFAGVEVAPALQSGEAGEREADGWTRALDYLDRIQLDFELPFDVSNMARKFSKNTGW